jgi:prepilin-type N-terminal cleavage/methylation domain-containing protein
MKQGFTLIELSIVLVIIGLIVGGVTVGQDLIRSAELNSVLSDTNKYQVAINSFKLKYNALPGDMNNATDYWGVAHATPATCATTASTGTETCDGDGNGALNGTEHVRFWQHLGNAEILPGTFTGIVGTAYNAGQNVPAGGVGGSIFLIVPGTSVGSSADQLYFMMCGSGATAICGVGDGILALDEAYNLDLKVDDAVADTGRFFADNVDSGGTELLDCTNRGGGTACAYDLSLNNVSTIAMEAD